MTQSFLGREDRELTQRLMAELPGILLWSIKGWRSLNERGRFVMPEASQSLHEEIKDHGSPMGQFVRECCIVEPTVSVRKSELYDFFVSWSRQNGYSHPCAKPQFGNKLRAAVPSIGDMRPGRQACGRGRRQARGAAGRPGQKRRGRLTGRLPRGRPRVRIGSNYAADVNLSVWFP
jgi:phage/plasmid-associated DNA primase